MMMVSIFTFRWSGGTVWMHGVLVVVVAGERLANLVYGLRAGPGVVVAPRGRECLSPRSALRVLSLRGLLLVEVPRSLRLLG